MFIKKYYLTTILMHCRSDYIRKGFLDFSRNLLFHPTVYWLIMSVSIIDQKRFIDTTYLITVDTSGCLPHLVVHIHPALLQ